jgi:hypothetical protein
MRRVSEVLEDLRLKRREIRTGYKHFSVLTRYWGALCEFPMFERWSTSALGRYTYSWLRCMLKLLSRTAIIRMN